MNLQFKKIVLILKKKLINHFIFHFFERIRMNFSQQTFFIYFIQILIFLKNVYEIVKKKIDDVIRQS